MQELPTSWRQLPSLCCLAPHNRSTKRHTHTPVRAKNIAVRYCSEITYVSRSRAKFEMCARYLTMFIGLVNISSDPIVLHRGIAAFRPLRAPYQFAAPAIFGFRRRFVNQFAARLVWKDRIGVRVVR